MNAGRFEFSDTTPFQQCETINLYSNRLTARKLDQRSLL